jgi:flagellar biosynthesis protein FliQ
MNSAQLLEILRDMFYTTILVSLPALAVSLIVGLFISVFQTVTSIQDQTLSYVPRIVFVGLAIIFTLGFTLQLAIAFTQRMFATAAGVGLQ